MYVLSVNNRSATFGITGKKRGVGVAESDWGSAFSSLRIPKISDANIWVWEHSCLGPGASAVLCKVEVEEGAVAGEEGR